MNLDENITSLKFVSTKYQSLLKKLGIYNIRDLLTYFPKKYSNLSEVDLVKNIYENYDPKKDYLFKGRIDEFKSIRLRGGKTLQKAIFTDESGKLDCMWFNQDYLKNVFQKNNEHYLLGRVKVKGSKYTFFPNFFEDQKKDSKPTHLARIVPDYALTSGISKKWFRNRIKDLINNLDFIPIKDEIAEVTGGNPNIKQYIKSVHFPSNETELSKATKALSIYELVNIQLKLLNKREKQNYKAFSAKINIDNQINKFIDSLSFELTSDQKEVSKNIINKMYSEDLLNELIQGDVGTGKTLVAIIASLFTVLQGYQVVILAPTTILANQHYKTFKNLLDNFNISIELVVSNNKKTKPCNILIGTSAVLARKNNLIKNMGLVIVDEQHRFGVKQREELLEPFKKSINRSFYPHFINMTATPIPRTIAESFFGNCSVSEIKTKPKDRKQIQTRLVPKDKRSACIDWIKEKIALDQDQVYWVCPLIEGNEKLDIKATAEVYSELKNELPEVRMGLLHGKLKQNDKDQIMTEFKEGRIDILVTTTVIEVGIDVANANIMVIENAERFGLAQLHQIRGRVGRGHKESWCFIFTGEEHGTLGYNRLQFFTNSNDGMEIAKYDLKTRGPGEVYGTMQSGLPNLRIASLTDLDLIKSSKDLAKKLAKKGIKSIELFADYVNN